MKDEKKPRAARKTAEKEKPNSAKPAPKSPTVKPKREPKSKTESAKPETVATPASASEPIETQTPAVELAPAPTVNLAENEPQFTIAPDAFRETLQSVERALAKKSTLPVLGMFHVQADAGLQRIKVTTTNLEFSLWRYARAQVNQSAALCFPQILTPLVGNAYKDELTITLNLIGGKTAHVQAGALSATLKCLDADEFPIVEPPPNLSKICALEFTRDELREIGSRVLSFAATDEARPVLTGIHLIADKQGNDGATIKLAGADGFRLAELTKRDILATFSDTQPPKNWKHALDVIVPARVFTEAEKLAPGDGEEDKTIGIAFYVYVPQDKDSVTDTDGSGIAFVDTPQGGMMSQLIVGAYPDTGKILKTDAELKTIPLSSLETLWALAGARLFAADSMNTVSLTYQDQRIIVKASSVENGNYIRVVRLPLDGIDLGTLPADGFKMAFNVRFLSEIIRAVTFQDSQTPVMLQVSTPTAPMYMRARNYKTVLMPMNVNDDKVVTQSVATAPPANELSTSEQSAIDVEPDAATIYDAAIASIASDPDPANLQDLAAEQVVEELDTARALDGTELADMSEPKIFTVICPCHTQLEIVEGSEEICPNCERILDNKGNVTLEPQAA